MRSEARAILGRPIAAPVTAPQGPTCIYEQRRDRAVTLAVEARDFEAIRRGSRPLARVRVDDRNGYCVEYGSVMMYVPLASGRVLNITAPCTIAARFAAKALPRLAS